MRKQEILKANSAKDIAEGLVDYKADELIKGYDKLMKMETLLNRGGNNR